LGIEQWKDYESNKQWYTEDTPPEGVFGTVLCSRDKDLHMIPGFKYVWPAGKQEEQFWFQDELSAIRCFYKQLLTGDTSDNILGLYGVGSSSKLVKSIQEMEEEQLMFNLVFKAYEDRFGTWAKAAMWENAGLLWILRENPVEVPFFDSIIMSPETEISKRLDELLSEYNNEEEKEQTESTSGL
jgi:hypothetical protein